MQKNNNIKVIVVNRPTKEQSEKITKELSAFLSKTWYTKIKCK